MSKNKKYLLLLLCSVAFLLICQKNTDEEIDIINISNTRGYSDHPAIAADSRGYFYVVWDEQFITQESLFIYMVTRSPDGEWSKPEKIFEPRAAQFPDIEVDRHNTIHLIWRNTDYEGWGEVLYTKKPLGGTWTEPDTISIYGMSCSPNFAVDNAGNIHLVWQELVDSWPIFYIKRTDDGIWSVPTEISSGDVFMRIEPKIAIDRNSNAHVVWEETKTDTGPTFAVYTTNAGCDTFCQSQDIYPFAGQFEEQLNPSIALTEDEVVHVVWAQNGDIFHTYKTLHTNWETPLRVCSTIAVSSRPNVSADVLGVLHLVWDEGNVELCYTSKSNDNEWEDYKRYTIDMYGFPTPKSAISTNSIGIVFSGYLEIDSGGQDNTEIFFVELPFY